MGINAARDNGPASDMTLVPWPPSQPAPPFTTIIRRSDARCYGQHHEG